MKDLLGQENVAKTVAKFVKMLWKQAFSNVLWRKTFSYRWSNYKDNSRKIFRGDEHE